MVKEVKDFEKDVLGKKEVLVGFNADWCGPCRMLRPILDEVDKDIISVNVDNNQDLAKKYGVMSIPCLILFKDGKDIKRSVGLISKNEVLGMFED